MTNTAEYLTKAYQELSSAQDHMVCAIKESSAAECILIEQMLRDVRSTITTLSRLA